MMGFDKINETGPVATPVESKVENTNEKGFTPEQQAVLDETPKLTSEIESLVNGGAIENLEPTKLAKLINLILENKGLIASLATLAVGAGLVAHAVIEHKWDIANMDVQTTVEAWKAIAGGFMVIGGGVAAASIAKIEVPYDSRSGFNG